jgi:hypothetical protein
MGLVILHLHINSVYGQHILQMGQLILFYTVCIHCSPHSNSMPSSKYRTSLYSTILLLLSLQIKGLSLKMGIFLVGFPTVHYGALGYKIETCSYPFYQFTSPAHWIVNEKIGIVDLADILFLKVLKYFSVCTDCRQ